MSSAAKIPNPRRFLSADAFIAELRRRFQEVPDRRAASGTKYSMADTLMAAFAMSRDPPRPKSLCTFQALFAAAWNEVLRGQNAIHVQNQRS